MHSTRRAAMPGSDPSCACAVKARRARFRFALDGHARWPETAPDGAKSAAGAARMACAPWPCEIRACVSPGSRRPRAAYEVAGRGRRRRSSGITRIDVQRDDSALRGSTPAYRRVGRRPGADAGGTWGRNRDVVIAMPALHGCHGDSDRKVIGGLRSGGVAKLQRESEGEPVPCERRSRPAKTRSMVDEQRHARIERLRRERMPMHGGSAEPWAAAWPPSAARARPCRPQTNGKAERFIQTCPRDWAYARICAHSAERTFRLPAFLAYRNARRSHPALGDQAPASRRGGNNLSPLDI